MIPHRPRHVGALLPLAPLGVLYAVVFFWPLLGIVFYSLYDGGLSVAHYQRALMTEVYRRALWNTLVIATLVTLGALVGSYPLAYLMATVRPAAARFLAVVVLLPFWTSALVRTTAWIILLQRNGILNTLLTRTGIVQEPIPFIYNLSGVLIGMIHVLMPFLVFPLYAAFRNIDRSLLEAAEGLGAGPLRILTRLVLPLTAPGAAAGSLIVFMNALGYYITPSLLGGPKQVMIAQMIAYQVFEQLNWGMAAALVVVLLAVTLAIFAVFQRLLGLDRLWGGTDGGGGTGNTLAATARTGTSRSAGGRAAAAAGAAAAIFLVAPILLVFPMSLSTSPFLVFPPPDYGLQWFRRFFSDPKWLRAGQASLEVAAVAVLLGTAVGTAAALGLSRLRFRLKTAAEGVVILPMVVPHIILAVGLYYLCAPAGLVGSKVALAVGHAVLGVPFVFITVSASLKTFDRNLELAALGLGASRLAAFRRVVVPHIWPGVAAGALFAFVVSFDEVILALFLTNIHSRTLPKVMYEGVAHEIDPTITAVAALLICLSFAALLLNLAFARRRTVA